VISQGQNLGGKSFRVGDDLFLGPGDRYSKPTKLVHIHIDKIIATYGDYFP
jgi:hypothetical protein